ncbi:MULTISPECIES: DUF982 domain-containing protein [Rhizobium]|jgi:hypothetical protein|uniref:DUF982 domain-containing protein n=1 Tax=Rhizobium tropici TaxID=398 RepID=A0A329YFZ7_RHITR|nr:MULTISPECIES: DUF982 domain-containing protein [Rhizobium]MBB3287260.1 hypothetical protein [Rhizobium sp. BK252]MBB3402000.1 hypothetical protein [Rhizobium sp. BK289]MBB3414577.1 hypothetical protein [Rhizobium sp. BK284]MBB3482466.1 hypothetical protein [Rhizobium sp. BK347]MDK4721327.1 DUF982 domain-containing protein [Rhizobium sp. CNPSo 3968]
MEYGDWNNPVIVDLGGAGRYAIITNALDAANCMSDEWPVSGGPAVDEAVLVCLDAVLGKASAEQSRRAFLEAAEEAGLDVRPDTESLH